jgi:hypothetical protein
MQGVLGTIGAFLSNSLRPRSRLARALVLLLVAKFSPKMTRGGGNSPLEN